MMPPARVPGSNGPTAARRAGTRTSAWPGTTSTTPPLPSLTVSSRGWAAGSPRPGGRALPARADGVPSPHPVATGSEAVDNQPGGGAAVASRAGNGVQRARRRGATRAVAGCRLRAAGRTRIRVRLRVVPRCQGGGAAARWAYGPLLAAARHEEKGQWIGTEAGAALQLFVFDGKGDPFLGRHCPAALEGRFVCGLAQPERCGGH